MKSVELKMPTTTALGALSRLLWRAWLFVLAGVLTGPGGGP